MRPVEFDKVPEGARAITYAENQEPYIPLPVLRLPSGEVCSRWKLTDAERELISNTGEIFLTQLTFNSPLQPVMLSVTEPTVEIGTSGRLEFQAESVPERLPYQPPYRWLRFQAQAGKRCYFEGSDDQFSWTEIDTATATQMIEYVTKSVKGLESSTAALVLQQTLFSDNGNGIETGNNNPA